jgi:hypothetical protein
MPALVNDALIASLAIALLLAVLDHIRVLRGIAS